MKLNQRLSKLKIIYSCKQHLWSYQVLSNKLLLYPNSGDLKKIYAFLSVIRKEVLIFRNKEKWSIWIVFDDSEFILIWYISNLWEEITVIALVALVQEIKSARCLHNWKLFHIKGGNVVFLSLMSGGGWLTSKHCYSELSHVCGNLQIQYNK